VTLQELLGEGLGAFELRRLAARTEALEAARLERIHHAHHERPFGADDGEVDAFVLRQPDAKESKQALDLIVQFIKAQTKRV